MRQGGAETDMRTGSFDPKQMRAPGALRGQTGPRARTLVRP